MFRSLPADVQIDADGKCKSCGSRVDSYSRCGIWIVWGILLVPGMLALMSKTREWSIEYLPDVSGTPMSMAIFASFGLIIVLSIYVSGRYGRQCANWVALPLVPLIFISQVVTVRHDPTWIAKAVDRLDEQTTRLEHRVSSDSFSAKDLQTWSEWQSKAKWQLEDSADKLGSIRVAVYGYAIDAASAFVFTTEGQKAEHDFFYDLQRQFLKRADVGTYVDEIALFVACYRKADREGISHRGVLQTESFGTCFEAGNGNSQTL